MIFKIRVDGKIKGQNGFAEIEYQHRKIFHPNGKSITCSLMNDKIDGNHSSQEKPQNGYGTVNENNTGDIYSLDRFLMHEDKIR